MDPVFACVSGAAVIAAYGYHRPMDVLRLGLRTRLRVRGIRDRDHTLPDARVCYWRGGRGAPLVFVHGFGTEAVVNWHAQLDAFARDYDVIAPDLAGFGASERLPGTNCIGLQVRCLRALLDDLGVGRIALVGHSMGGWISLAFAAAYPSRVERLVVVDAAGLRFEPDMTLERALLPATIDDVRSLIRANFRRPMRVPTFVLRDVLRVARRDAVPREALLRRLVYGDEHVDDHLERVTTPTLVVWGAADPLTPLALGERIVAGIPRASLSVFADCAHSPNIEQPERFNRLVREFLRAEVGADAVTETIAAHG